MRFDADVSSIEHRKTGTKFDATLSLANNNDKIISLDNLMPFNLKNL